MRRAWNPVVSRHCALSLSIRCLPFFDRGIKGIRELGRAGLVMFHLGDQTGDGLPQFFALAGTFTVVLDDEGGRDTEKYHEQLTRQSADMRTPILFRIVCGHTIVSTSSGSRLIIAQVRMDSRRIAVQCGLRTAAFLPLTSAFYPAVSKMSAPRFPQIGIAFEKLVEPLPPFGNVDVSFFHALGLHPFV